MSCFFKVPASQAALITHNGYTLDTSNNIITGGGFEWLNWTETAGHSIFSALAANAGWELATNEQMINLLTDFFPGNSLSTDENLVGNGHTGASEAALDDDISKFQDIFGITFSVDDFCDAVKCRDYAHPWSIVKSLYGSDLDGDGLFNMAEIRVSLSYTDTRISDGAWVGSGSSFGGVILTQDLPGRTINYSTGPTVGVALVRDIKSITLVPEPTSLPLLMLGFLVAFFKFRFFGIKE